MCFYFLQGHIVFSGSSVSIQTMLLGERCQFDLFLDCSFRKNPLLLALKFNKCGYAVFRIAASLLLSSCLLRNWIFQPCPSSKIDQRNDLWLRLRDLNFRVMVNLC